jgi:hypothetical protein
MMEQERGSALCSSLGSPRTRETSNMPLPHKMKSETSWRFSSLSPSHGFGRSRRRATGWSALVIVSRPAAVSRYKDQSSVATASEISLTPWATAGTRNAVKASIGGPDATGAPKISSAAGDDSGTVLVCHQDLIVSNNSRAQEIPERFSNGIRGLSNIAQVIVR